MTTATKKSAEFVAMTAGSLKSLLSVLSPAFNSRSPAVAARYVRFANGRASLAGNQVAIHARCDGEHQPSPFLAPYASLQRIATSCDPTATLKISSRENGCMVHSATEGKWILLSEPYDEWFEPFDDEQEDPLCRLPVDEFLRAARGSSFAIDKTSPTALSCELIQISDGVVSFVGSDGRRVAHVACEIDQAVDDRLAMIPAYCFAAIASVASKCDDEGGIQFEVAKKYARATLLDDEVEVICSLRDGSYMNWAKLFEGKRLAMCEVRAGALIDALRKSSVCVSETTRSVRIRVSGSELTIDCESSERGSSAVGCELVGCGSDGEADINPDYLREWLSCNEPEEVVSFDLGNTTKGPTYFECDGRRYLLAKIETS